MEYYHNYCNSRFTIWRSPITYVEHRPKHRSLSSRHTFFAHSMASTTSSGPSLRAIAMKKSSSICETLDHIGLIIAVLIEVQHNTLPQPGTLPGRSTAIARTENGTVSSETQGLPYRPPSRETKVPTRTGNIISSIAIDSSAPSPLQLHLVVGLKSFGATTIILLILLSASTSWNSKTRSNFDLDLLAGSTCKHWRQYSAKYFSISGAPV